MTKISLACFADTSSSKHPMPIASGVILSCNSQCCMLPVWLLWRNTSALAPLPQLKAHPKASNYLCSLIIIILSLMWQKLVCTMPISPYSPVRIINICSIQFEGTNLNASLMNLLVMVVCYIIYA